jgi:hypothetical protein
MQISAQDIVVATHSQYKQFKASTTYVVKYDNPFSAFNTAMATAMKKYWYFTNFEVITTVEFEKKQADRNASFLFLSEAMAEKREDLKFNILNIVMGSKSASLNNMPDLGSVPLSYAFDEDEFAEEGYLYKLGVVLKFIQYYAEANIKKADTDIKSLVKTNSKEIINKEVWFIKEDLDTDVNTIEKIARVYSGKVKIVTETEIEQAVESGNKQVLILHKVGPGKGKTGKCLKFIIGAADGAPYYYNITEVTAKNPDAFSADDFKKL